MIETPTAPVATKSPADLQVELTAAIQEHHAALQARQLAQEAFESACDRVKTTQGKVGLAKQAILDACTPLECVDDWKNFGF